MASKTARIFGACKTRPAQSKQSSAFRDAHIWKLSQAKRHAEQILRGQGYSRKESARIASEMYTRR